MALLNILASSNSSFNSLISSIFFKLLTLNSSCLEISFQYKGKDKLLGNVDKAYSNFEVIKKPKADLILGLP
jgi:hypothetical protein